MIKKNWNHTNILWIFNFQIKIQFEILIDFFTIDCTRIHNLPEFIDTTASDLRYVLNVEYIYRQSTVSTINAGSKILALCEFVLITMLITFFYFLLLMYFELIFMR